MITVTAESVTEGHPDKMADIVADLVLDACLAQDPQARVACEVLLTGRTAVVAGELTTTAEIDVPAIVRHVCGDVETILRIQRQAPALRETADSGGANDQGIVVGYAVNETPELMPLAQSLAHKITRRLAEVRNSGLLPYLRPDGKAQVTVTDGRVTTVVVSTQHDTEVSLDTLRADVRDFVVLPITGESRILVNPQQGRFEVGGILGDTGLTGRKIVMDAYGPEVPNGGGSFSGKDPSKTDRSGAYALRQVAKTIVASGLATRCLVTAAYCIGRREPVALTVETFGTGDVREAQEFAETFDLTPEGIIERLDLRRPIYRETAVYGHFGRAGVPWETAEGNLVALPPTSNTVKHVDSLMTVD